jgi:predicted small lipoprotein YifL
MRTLFVMLAASTLTACAQFGPARATPYWDTHFGANARLALAQQVIYPDAGRNADPVAGIDGKAAQQGYARYQKSFSDPPPQPTFIIDAK